MSIQFTDRQLDIMNILWNRGSATVRETRKEMDDDLACTSVLTVFQTLEKNGHVEHEQEGKAYRYEPTVSRREAGDDAVEYVLRRLFENSPEALATSLAGVADGPEEETVLTGDAA